MSDQTAREQVRRLLIPICQMQTTERPTGEQVRAAEEAFEELVSLVDAGLWTTRNAE